MVSNKQNVKRKPQRKTQRKRSQRKSQRKTQRKRSQRKTQRKSRKRSPRKPQRKTQRKTQRKPQRKTQRKPQRKTQRKTQMRGGKLFENTQRFNKDWLKRFLDWMRKVRGGKKQQKEEIHRSPRGDEMTGTDEILKGKEDKTHSTIKQIRSDLKDFRPPPAISSHHTKP